MLEWVIKNKIIAIGCIGTAALMVAAIIGRFTAIIDALKVI